MPTHRPSDRRGDVPLYPVPPEAQAVRHGVKFPGVPVANQVRRPKFWTSQADRRRRSRSVDGLTIWDALGAAMIVLTVIAAACVRWGV